MTTITKEQAVRDAFEQWADSTQPSYWRTTAWAHQAWIDFQTPYKLGRNAGLNDAWRKVSDLADSHDATESQRHALDLAADAIESLKDNTP